MHWVSSACATEEALEAARARAGVGLDGLAQLLTYGLGRLPEGVSLDGVFIQEECDVDQC